MGLPEGPRILSAQTIAKLKTLEGVSLLRLARYLIDNPSQFSNAGISISFASTIMQIVSYPAETKNAIFDQPDLNDDYLKKVDCPLKDKAVALYKKIKAEFKEARAKQSVMQKQVSSSAVTANLAGIVKQQAARATSGREGAAKLPRPISRAESKNGTIQKLRAEIDELKQTISNLKRDLLAANRDNPEAKQLELIIAKLEGDLRSANEQLQTYKRERTALQTANASLTRQLEAAQNELDEARDEVAERDKIIAILRQQIEEQAGAALDNSSGEEDLPIDADEVSLESGTVTDEDDSINDVETESRRKTYDNYFKELYSSQAMKNQYQDQFDRKAVAISEVLKRYLIPEAQRCIRALSEYSSDRDAHSNAKRSLEVKGVMRCLAKAITELEDEVEHGSLDDRIKTECTRTLKTANPILEQLKKV